MPRFPGCEDVEGNDKKKEQCAQGKLMKYIVSNIKYPPMAREVGKEGIAVVTFVVDSKGKVKNAQLLRDPGSGLGKEAMRIVKKMAKDKTWIPGMQRAEAVDVKFTLPIRFKLK